MTRWLNLGAQSYSGLLGWAVQVVLLAVVATVSGGILLLVFTFVASRRSRIVRCIGGVGLLTVVLIGILSAIDGDHVSSRSRLARADSDGDCLHDDGRDDHCGLAFGTTGKNDGD